MKIAHLPRRRACGIHLPCHLGGPLFHRRLGPSREADVAESVSWLDRRMGLLYLGGEYELHQRIRINPVEFLQN